MLRGRRDDATARRIVDRPGTEVPAVEVAGDHDWTRSRIAARHLGNDIARMLRAQILRGQHKLHAHRLGNIAEFGLLLGHHQRALPLAHQLVSVGVRQRARGDRLHAVFEIGAADVRHAVVVGADRADDDRDRALLRRGVGAKEAPAAILAIAAAVLRRLHLVVDEDDLALHLRVGRRDQRIIAREIDNIAFNPLGSGRGTVAERRDGQLLGKERADQRRLLGAAHPHRHVELFLTDIGEPHCLQSRHRPAPRGGFGFGPRHALADLGRQILGDRPGDIVAALCQLNCGRRRRRRNGGGAGGDERRGGKGEARRADQGSDDFHVAFVTASSARASADCQAAAHSLTGAQHLSRPPARPSHHRSKSHGRPI